MPRSSNGSGCWPFKPAMPGSIPARGTTWPVSETGHHETLRTSYSGFESWAGYLIRDEGELAPRLAWDQEIAGSSPAIPTCGHFNTARSFNGRGRRPDKAETKVRLLLGLFKQQTTEPDMLTLHRLKQIPTPHTRSWCNGSTADF